MHGLEEKKERLEVRKEVGEAERGENEKGRREGGRFVCCLHGGKTEEKETSVICNVCVYVCVRCSVYVCRLVNFV